MANWNDTAEKYVERRRAEQLRRLEEEETHKRKLDQAEFEYQ